MGVYEVFHGGDSICQDMLWLVKALHDTQAEAPVPYELVFDYSVDALPYMLNVKRLRMIVLAFIHGVIANHVEYLLEFLRTLLFFFRFLLRNVILLWISLIYHALIHHGLLSALLLRRRLLRYPLEEQVVDQ